MQLMTTVRPFTPLYGVDIRLMGHAALWHGCRRHRQDGTFCLRRVDMLLMQLRW